MKIDVNTNLETLRQMMGPEATMREAAMMWALLSTDSKGRDDTDLFSDSEFFDLTAEAIRLINDPGNVAA